MVKSLNNLMVNIVALILNEFNFRQVLTDLSVLEYCGFYKYTNELIPDVFWYGHFWTYIAGDLEILSLKKNRYILHLGFLHRIY